MVTTTARAMFGGLFNVVSGRVPRMAVRLESGDEAPDFALTGSDGRLYRLSDFRDRQPVVLAWFPKAFTPGCANECRSLGAAQAEIESRGVRFFAVSGDDPETNRRFARSLGLEYPVLSDEDGSVARAYGVLGTAGFPSRWTFVIASDGRIAAVDRAVRAFSHGRDLAALLDRLTLTGAGAERMGRPRLASGRSG
jgi:peroxiredoxin Q/BCP